MTENDRTTPVPPSLGWRDPKINPHRFEDHVLEALADTSAKMYDNFYDLLASYNFDFTLEEKTWMLDRIRNDIAAMNENAEQDSEEDQGAGSS